MKNMEKLGPSQKRVTAMGGCYKSPFLRPSRRLCARISFNSKKRVCEAKLHNLQGKKKGGGWVLDDERTNEKVGFEKRNEALNGRDGRSVKGHRPA